MTSTDPADVHAVWSISNGQAVALADAIACPTANFCTLGDIFGSTAISTNPTGGAKPRSTVLGVS
jgi:hypothetical protein